MGCQRHTTMTVEQVQLTEQQWINVFQYFKGLPGQRIGLLKLRKYINKADPSLLVDSADWLADYRLNPVVANSVHLDVPYEYQNDNESQTGYRECFSSSCAMLAKRLGKVGNDDEYNRIRQRYGETTSAEAQLRALRSLGLTADFHTDGHTDDLLAELRAKRPVAVGWLHHGTPAAPSGGGHWSVIVGFKDNGSKWIHHDPNGEADLLNGGYVNHSNGKSILYSSANWLPRWQPGGSGGWYLTCR